MWSSPRIFPDIAVIRLPPDGELDPSFAGGDGIATFSRGDDVVFGFSVDVGSDGRVAVGGSVWHSTADSLDQRAMLLRFDATGEPDQTFSGDGVRLSNAHEFYFDVLQTGSKLLAAGVSCTVCEEPAGFVSRFHGAGTLDRSFSDDGSAILDWVNPTSLDQLDVDAAGGSARQEPPPLRRGDNAR